MGQRDRARRDRHPGRRDPTDRAAGEAVERRLRRVPDGAPRVGPPVGGEPPLRTVRTACQAAVPAPRTTHHRRRAASDRRMGRARRPRRTRRRRRDRASPRRTERVLTGTRSVDPALDELYRDLAAEGLVPLWTEIGDLMPSEPCSDAIPHLWRWSSLMGIAERAGDLVPVGRGGERRAIALREPRSGWASVRDAHPVGGDPVPERSRVGAVASSQPACVPVRRVRVGCLDGGQR